MRAKMRRTNNHTKITYGQGKGHTSSRKLINWFRNERKSDRKKNRQSKSCFQDLIKSWDLSGYSGNVRRTQEKKGKKIPR